MANQISLPFLFYSLLLSSSIAFLGTSSFTVFQNNHHYTHAHSKQHSSKTITSSSFATTSTTPQPKKLSMSKNDEGGGKATLAIRSPSQDEAVDLGIREWPSQPPKVGKWKEETKNSLTRYVLQGEGKVSVDLENFKNVGPGSLVEITPNDDNDDDVVVLWETTTKEEMIILTPGYEEGGKLLGVAAGLILVCGALIVGLGG